MRGRALSVAVLLTALLALPACEMGSPYGGGYPLFDDYDTSWDYGYDDYGWDGGGGFDCCDDFYYKPSGGDVDDTW